MEAHVIARSKAYLTQYISLMLIVLCITVGALMRPKVDAPEKPKKVEVIKKAKVAPIVISGLGVLEAKDSPNFGSANAVAYLLQNHDLDAHYELRGPNLKSAQDLRDALIEAGAPPGSVQVRVVIGSPKSAVIAERAKLVLVTAGAS